MMRFLIAIETERDWRMIYFTVTCQNLSDSQYLYGEAKR